ncbi:hypothetical protein DPMN_045415 [Dreissena polymorpha]|uniref:Uncharacterized protein n=1 Tax=Dreissena polymorpha TaxID=45954 RepID=A0A9D4HZW7_DREPO|nr:hypothetical protein DPMN_045415 [Dreissena polymorpha]
MPMSSSLSSQLSSLDRTQTVVAGRDITISLEEIKHEQPEIKSILATLMQRLNGVTLPVANVEAIHELEEKLRDDTTMRVMVDNVPCQYKRLIVDINDQMCYGRSA